MKKEKALNLEEKFRALCEENGLWLKIEHEIKPDLKMIRIKEISIKVD